MPTAMEAIRPEEAREGEVRLVTCDFQTHGHGQTGTVWESDRGANLTFSFAFKPKGVAAAENFLLSEIACLAVARTLDAYVGDITVKWPNDVYWRDRKICGMLLRHRLSGANVEATLIGIGLNVNQETFHGDAPNPVSLRRILGRKIPLDRVLAAFAAHFEALLHTLDTEGSAAVHRRYLRRLYHADGTHPYIDAATKLRFEAAIADVALDGTLALRLADGTLRRYAFKEVRFVHP